MIAADLRDLAFPVNELHLLPGNPRRGDSDAVARSLAAFGQRKPIVARRSDRVVIAGNHTLQAAQSLGWPQIAVVWTDDDDATAAFFCTAGDEAVAGGVGVAGLHAVAELVGAQDAVGVLEHVETPV